MQQKSSLNKTKAPEVTGAKDMKKKIRKVKKDKSDKRERKKDKRGA